MLSFSKNLYIYFQKNKNMLQNIDKKDLAILQELDIDVRYSYAQIGRKVRLSKEAIKYRIKNLEKKGIITGYWMTPTIGSANFVYKLLIKNKSLGIKKKKDFIEFALKQKAVSWLATTEGNWDFVISSYLGKDVDFSEFVVELMKRFGKYLKEKHIIKSTALIAMNEKYLHNKEFESKIIEDSFLADIKELDDVNKKIIRLLSNNARISFSELGREVNLTPEAVGKRYRDLIKNNMVVSMNPRINHEKLGLQYYHIFISVSDYEKKDAICNYYTQHHSCVFIMKHIGHYDIHLEIVLKPEEIDYFIDELSENFGEYISAYEPLRIRKEHIMIVTR